MRYGVPDRTPFLGLRIFCAYFGLPPSAYSPPDIGSLNVVWQFFFKKIFQEESTKGLPSCKYTHQGGGCPAFTQPASDFQPSPSPHRTKMSACKSLARPRFYSTVFFFTSQPRIPLPCVHTKISTN